MLDKTTKYENEEMKNLKEYLFYESMNLEEESENHFSEPKCYNKKKL